MVILGIDPGLNVTGYGVLQIGPEGIRIAEAGVVRGGSRSLESRLVEIFNGVSEVLTAFPPSAVAIEQLYSHYDRPRTAILMGHARGLRCGRFAKYPCGPLRVDASREDPHGQWKGAEIADAVPAICRELRLPSPPEPPDVADALAIALCHHYLGRGIH